MDIVNKLKKELLKQAFTEEQKQTERLNECKHITAIYAQTENAIAVLSDMKANISYIYYGGVALRNWDWQNEIPPRPFSRYGKKKYSVTSIRTTYRKSICRNSASSTS